MDIEEAMEEFDEWWEQGQAYVCRQCQETLDRRLAPSDEIILLCHTKDCPAFKKYVNEQRYAQDGINLLLQKIQKK